MFLNCHTWFSFKYGTLSPERLFEEARRNQVNKLVLTEINNTSSYIEMLRICAERREEFALDIAVGMEFRSSDALQFISIAKNNDGFEKLNRYRSHLNRQGHDAPSRAPVIENNIIIYPFEKTDPSTLRANEYIGIKVAQLTKFAMHPEYHAFLDKFVALHPVTFADKEGFNIHRLLRAIDCNLLLSKLPVHQQASEDERLVSPRELEHAFSRFPSLVSNAKKIVDACSLQVDFNEPKNKKSVTGSEASDWDVLVTEAWEGFQKRYDATNPVMRERFERELSIIKLKNFVAYYLIAFDVVSFARQNGITHVGRGSGANSMVAFCLGITDVDPIELDLYFERFLNPERTSPPDFDLDFSWKDRDRMYEYIFRKFGTEHTCLLATHVTYQGRSIIRELAKVFGLPKSEIDEIVEDPRRNQDRDHITQLVFKYAKKMTEMPSHLSIHAGGIVITEKPLYCYTTTDLPAKGFHVSQFEMNAAEDFSIFKLDILSQRGLGHIKEAVEIVRKNRGTEIDVNDFARFKNDEKIKELLRTSRCMGCFYVESPAMRQLLGKLECEDYLTLVAASSIIRPGVASSGMMRAYIERHHATRHGKRYESIHPKIDELLRETYGVMVYQEDVIKVAHYFGGLTLSEADILRRAMSGKFRSRKSFDVIKEKFFANCKSFGYADAVSERVWFEIQSFGGYSFAKGHSASYAVESYQSLFLKAYYPLEFMVAVINNFGGFYSTEFYFHELRMNGGEIEAPCINRSEYLTSIDGKRVFIGFIHLKGLENELAKGIQEEREKHGVFTSLSNFLERVATGLEQVRILIRIGAFRSTGKNKQELLWEALLYFGKGKIKQQGSGKLFNEEIVSQPLPALERNTIEDAFDEIELLNFPLGNPFELLAEKEFGDTCATDLPSKIGQEVSIVGYLITTKDTYTKTKEPMYFGTFYDRHGHVFDSVNFPQIAQRYPFRGRGFYMIRGKVMDDFGVQNIEVMSMEKLSLVNKRQLPVKAEAMPVAG